MLGREKLRLASGYAAETDTDAGWDAHLTIMAGAVGGRQYSPIVEHFYAVRRHHEQIGDRIALFVGRDEIRDRDRALYVIDGIGMGVNADWGDYLDLIAIITDDNPLPRRAYMLHSAPAEVGAG